MEMVTGVAAIRRLNLTEHSPTGTLVTAWSPKQVA